ncbi:MAG: hypothetical protein MUD01_23200 [Chloroflexaceae bacterium]|jgi:tetratricopeptide (TPR) repeat protein|nr:hypothetical protein [Chloroflexaceae bacterium]
MTTTETLLQRGIDAARVGRRENARELLMQVVQQDERNELAWLWLSGVVDTPEDQRVCLENVLEINPGNQHARRGLAMLEERAKASSSNGEQSAAPVAVSGVAVPPKPAAPVLSPTSVTAPEPEETPMLAEVSPTRYPCPYCGKPTSLRQRTCGNCRKALTYRLDAPEKRSLPLLLLVALWAISGLILIIGGGFLVAATIRLIREEGLEAFNAVAAPTVTGIGGILLAAILAVALAVALWRRRVWAYFTTMGMVGVGFLGLVALAGSGGQLLAALPQAGGGAVPGFGNAITLGLNGPLICSAVLLLGAIALCVIIWPDFYGRTARLVSEVPLRDDVGHYNAGVSYKNQGMWYMAAREWEQAVSKKQRNPNYRHALGLAYAQISEFSLAVQQLRTAAQLAPKDNDIQDSLAAVERRAEQARN